MESSRSHTANASRGLGDQDTPSIKGKRVLLAEDDESARTVVAIMLRAMGLDVIDVADGGRLLVAVTSLYKEGRSPSDIDLVITDLQMPVLNGLDVFKALRAARWTTPVILTTGHDTPEVQATVARLGAVLLPKPLDLDVLERTVRDILSRPAPPMSSRRLVQETHSYQP